jgi:cation diffusion facilitator family transporter
MITLLRRLFIKDYTNVGEESIRVKHGKVAAIFGIISNLLLVTMKIVAAVLIATSAYNASTAADKMFTAFLPVALIADAINNLSDMASSLVTLIGFKISAKPADKEHPFGHERIEYIAGLVVSTIVLVLAVELFRDSLTKIISHETVEYDLTAVIVLGVAVLMKLMQSYVNKGMGKAISSEALQATALDSFTDAIATCAIMISGILCLIPSLHWNFLDGYMGIIVSLFVGYSGIKMIKETADPLIGEQGNQELVESIVKDVKSHPGILGCHDILCHSYGPTKYFVSLHAEIDQNTPMLEAHDLIDDIEREIKHKYHCDITIHMDPVAVGDKLTDEISAEVKGVLLGISPDLKYHDFRIVVGPTHINVIFDVLLPYDEKVTQDLIMKTLEEHFKGQKPERFFVVTFDRPY